MNAAFPWTQLLAVALGSALGGLARWQVQSWLNPRWLGFPLGTLLVNCVGGLFIGIALAWFERSPNELWRLFVITGCLGGLTTFSSFSGESLLLLQRGAYAMALAHAAAHLLGALTCAAAGYWLIVR
jgi:fluoride exporter